MLSATFNTQQDQGYKSYVASQNNHAYFQAQAERHKHAAARQQELEFESIDNAIRAIIQNVIKR